METRNELTTRLARCLVVLWFGVNAVLFTTPAAFATQQVLDDIRHQSGIASSYNFSPLPSNAGEGITVAIVSQGITRNLKDIVGDHLSVVSVISSDTSPYAGEDSFGIGNGMVSIVAALAPGAKIINIKSLDDMGSGSYEDIKNGISRATESGAKILVLPIGAEESDDGVSSVVKAAIGKGILVVASAGNQSGGQVNFPANMDGVLAIGASNQQQKVASFSSIGSKVIYAPGEDIKGVEQDDKLGSHSGTSHSSAVAGAIFAVLWSQNPSLSRQQLVDAVMKSTKEIEDVNGGKCKLIDGAAALRAINDAKATTQ